MSQEENVTVTLAAISMEIAVVISVIFNVLIVCEFDKHCEPIKLIIMVE